VGVSFGGASSPASPDTDEVENKAIEGEKAGSGCASLVSVNMEGRTILLYHLNERENALELQFQPRYGAIVAYRWFGDG
jgi:WD repeat-containing protein 19